MKNHKKHINQQNKVENGQKSILTCFWMGAHPKVGQNTQQASPHKIFESYALNFVDIYMIKSWLDISSYVCFLSNQKRKNIKIQRHLRTTKY